MNSKPQRNSTGEIEFVQIVVITDHPASAPEWITPVSVCGAGDISWRPLDLATKSKMLTDVIFNAAAKEYAKRVVFGTPLRLAEISFV